VASRLRVGPDPLSADRVTLLAPYVAWTLGERAHASPVLACVAGGSCCPGLSLQRDAEHAAPGARRLGLRALRAERNALPADRLQLPSLVASVASDAVCGSSATGSSFGGIAIATRLRRVPLMTWLPRRSRRRCARAIRCRLVGVFVTRGPARGAVSLAAALALPLALPTAPAAAASELILITFVVIFCTLVIQGARSAR
jgi:CPA1 family monovalent cation:H+ antiporter